MNMIMLNTITILFVIGVIYIFILYISLVKKKNNVNMASAEINVYLKRRYDLIPNILTIANKFMEHEKEIFSKIVQLRTQALKISNKESYLPQKIEIDTEIKTLMEQLQITAENYPQLKSNKIMRDTIRSFNYTEEYIAAARRYYNAAVKEFNNSVEIFPSSIIASILGYKKTEFIKADDNERKELNKNSQYFTK